MGRNGLLNSPSKTMHGDEDLLNMLGYTIRSLLEFAFYNETVSAWEAQAQLEEEKYLLSRALLV